MPHEDVGSIVSHARARELPGTAERVVNRRSVAADALTAAVDALGFYDARGAILAGDYRP